MKKEDAELLEKDLASRVLYGVKVQHRGKTEELIEVGDGGYGVVRNYPGAYFELTGMKPYLRPLESMTDEEYTDWQKAGFVDVQDDYWSTFKNAAIMSDWADRKMFDHRGLIDKGLALPAIDGMYGKN